MADWTPLFVGFVIGSIVWVVTFLLLWLVFTGGPPPLLGCACAP